jgi:DNA-binding NtrC family response regulator
MVARAAGGTLFLDEIGDPTPASQVKLLRLLQERQYHPLGSDVPKVSDARILCATHRDLQARMAEEGERG